MNEDIDIMGGNKKGARPPTNLEPWKTAPKADAKYENQPTDAPTVTSSTENAEAGRDSPLASSPIVAGVTSAQSSTESEETSEANMPSSLESTVESTTEPDAQAQVSTESSTDNLEATPSFPSESNAISKPDPASLEQIDPEAEAIAPGREAQPDDLTEKGSARSSMDRTGATLDVWEACDSVESKLPAVPTPAQSVKTGAGATELQNLASKLELDDVLSYELLYPEGSKSTPETPSESQPREVVQQKCLDEDPTNAHKDTLETSQVEGDSTEVQDLKARLEHTKAALGCANETIAARDEELAGIKVKHTSEVQSATDKAKQGSEKAINLLVKVISSKILPIIERNLDQTLKPRPETFTWELRMLAYL